jgi:hypothetical protein
MRREDLGDVCRRADAGDAPPQLPDPATQQLGQEVLIGRPLAGPGPEVAVERPLAGEGLLQVVPAPVPQHKVLGLKTYIGPSHGGEEAMLAWAACLDSSPPLSWTCERGRGDLEAGVEGAGVVQDLVTQHSRGWQLGGSVEHLQGGAVGLNTSGMSKREGRNWLHWLSRRGRGR